MKLLITTICFLFCKPIFAQVELDTLYLCVNYPGLNEFNYRGNTTNNSELLFFKVKDQKKVNLTAPLTLKDAKSMRCVRLLFEKGTRPDVGIKIMYRSLFSGKKGPYKEFDTLFNIKQIAVDKKLVVFRYFGTSPAQNFDFRFIESDNKLYIRSLKKLRPRRIIAEYNFTNNKTIFYRKNAKVLIDE